MRALKFIPRLNEERHDRESDALTGYRHSAEQLRSPTSLLMEPVNRRNAGLFYIVPLCAGLGADEPTDFDR